MADYVFADAHCHLDSCAGVLMPHALLITSGTSHETNLKNLRIAEQNQNVYMCAGISPQEAMKHPDIQIVLQEWEDTIATKIADSGKLVAIGEIGLDFHWGKTAEEKHLQQECFVSELQLAERLALPVVIHSRDAEAECLDILRNFNLDYMLHCFSGKYESAVASASGKGTVSIPPLRNSERKRFIRDIPLEKLVAESDAPGIGKTPQDAMESIKMIAEIKELGVEQVQHQTLLNTISFFRIK
ncbi:Tat-linked quality control protein TatD [uncultured archaeon]|nr:Tat-linked quality control protein TatD [uncultured archaeon]